MQHINCKGQLISLDSPKVMGILNVTPDSFFDGGKYKDEISIVTQVEKMLTDGATFIDIGAYSSRPNATEVSVTEEKQRLLPIVELILKKFPETLISVDTFPHKINDLIIDPGFGFGKTIAHNYTILKQLQLFKMLDFPVLAGVSRKSMIYKVLETSAQEALNGTSVLHTIALQNGASILRAHDVKEAMECVKLVGMVFD